MTIEQIFKNYYAKLHSFIQSRVGDKAVADDILQDVFIKIDSRIDTLKDSSKIQSWIYQITRNAIIDHFRTRKTTEELSYELAASETDDIEKARQTLEDCLMPMIQNLPEPYRQALMLSEIEGLTQKQLAEKQDISLSGAKSRVQRGRAKVKDMLLECCRFEFDHQGKVIDFEGKSKSCRHC